MDPESVSYHRLFNQQISQPKFREPVEVVRHFAALQAQDYYASLWGIGLRTASNITEEDVEQAVARRKIVRTWPMRGTLHFVAAADVRWLLKLLTPWVIKQSARRHHDLELDEKVFNKSRTILEKNLQEGNQFTRDEVYTILEKEGISTNGQRGYHILWYLAQNAVICQGTRKGKQHTFTLLEEWIPGGNNLKGDEALAELASRYIKSHGPATEYDFANWSGLKVITARKALTLIEDDFEKEETEKQTWWFPNLPETNQKTGRIYMLPGFDEIICGYKDRSAILKTDAEKKVILRNGIFRPVIISGGKVAGSWKRSLNKENVVIETELFQKLNKKEKQELIQQGKKYGEFLGLKTEFDSNL